MCPIIIISSLGFAKKMLRCQSKCDMITLENALAKSLKDSPLGSFGIVEKLCNNASKSNDFLGIPWKISFCHKVIFWAKLQALSGQRATKKYKRYTQKEGKKWQYGRLANNKIIEEERGTDWCILAKENKKKENLSYVCTRFKRALICCTSMTKSNWQRITNPMSKKRDHEVEE